MLLMILLSIHLLVCLYIHCSLCLSILSPVSLPESVEGTDAECSGQAVQKGAYFVLIIPHSHHQPVTVQSLPDVFRQLWDASKARWMLVLQPVKPALKSWRRKHQYNSSSNMKSYLYIVTKSKLLLVVIEWSNYLMWHALLLPCQEFSFLLLSHSLLQIH